MKISFLDTKIKPKRKTATLKTLLKKKKLKKSSFDFIPKNYPLSQTNSETSMDKISRKKDSSPKKNILQNQKSLKDFKKNPNYKTEICKNFEINKKCQWGDQCCFAHGRKDLREKMNLNSQYKTKICKNYHFKGYCQYGSRCQYFHFKSFNIYKELLDSYKTMTTVENMCLIFEVLGKDSKRRLPVFEDIFNLEKKN